MKRYRPWWLWRIPVYFVLGLVLGWGTISPVWWTKPAWWILIANTIVLATWIPWAAKPISPKEPTSVQVASPWRGADPSREYFTPEMLESLEWMKKGWDKAGPAARSADWYEWAYRDDRPFTALPLRTALPRVEGWQTARPNLVMEGIVAGRHWTAWRIHRTWHIAFDLAVEPVDGAVTEPAGVGARVRLSEDRLHLVCHPEAGTPAALERWLRRAGALIAEHAIQLELDVRARQEEAERLALTAEPEHVEPAVTIDGLWEQPDHSIVNAEDLR